LGEPTPTTEPEVEPSADGGSDGDQFERLRELLVGGERRQLDELRQEFEQQELTSEEVAERLPEAIALSGAQDESLARALAPTIEAGIDESVERDPQRIAQAVYPVLGPAIRKAIAETMAGFVNTLNRAIDNSLSARGFKWRFEAWRTGVPYAQIAIRHALVYSVEQVFLIHRDTGLMLVHEHSEEAEAKDPDLVSGMLTAIRDFVSDSFDAEGEGGLEVFRVGNLNVLVERGPQALLAAVVRGQPPAELRGEMQRILELVHLHFRAPLAAFDGDSEPFEPAQGLVDDLLETVLDTDAPERRSAAPRVAWAVLTLLVLGAIAWFVYSHLQWKRTLETLEGAPGIVLIEAERSFGSWRLRGLFDNDVADPDALLAASGVDPEDVEADWKPYLSLESLAVSERAKRLLAPPGSVELELREGGRLVGAGSSSPSWRARAEEIAPTLPGVLEADFSGVEATPSPELDRVRGEVESLRVLFRVGSADLVTESRAALAELQPAFERLSELAEAQGWHAAIEIVGRTDATGNEETNQLLSRQRADTVRAALIGAGYSASAFQATGVGVSDPLSAEDAETASRLNRSASFRVELRPEGARSGWGE
jgi:OOP family OmpA-OmpF porin